MTGDEWQRLKAAFQDALDRPPAERRASLARALANDPALQHEAELLLAAHDTAGDFLEQPVTFETDDADAIDSETSAEAALAPGAHVGPYTIIDELGRGGMGIVYVAEDRRLGRRVALKSLPGVRAGDETLRERLRREARAAATIAHPGVATIYALEEIDDQLFIASELVGGHTLRDEIDRGPIEPSRVRTIAIQIARALGAAHAAGVVHRDLKPENILVTDDGIKIVDFGIAADVRDAGLTKLTRDGSRLGTPAYMAPEQLVGAASDARVDVYAFGIVLDEMLTGRHRFAAAGSGEETPARRFGRRPRGQQIEQPVSAGHTGSRSASVSLLLTAVVERCVHIDPAGRYPSADALLAELERTDTDAQRFPSAADAAVPRAGARWWWQFHQATAASLYWLMVVPAWGGRQVIGGVGGRAFFVIVLGAVIIAANLRLHLWFTSRFYPAELKWVRRRVGRWIQVGDWVFASSLVAAGLIIGEERSLLAAVLIGVGIGTAVAFLLIEPATARAAFKTTSATDAGHAGTHRGA